MALRWRIALTLLVTIVGSIYVLPSIPAVQNSPLARILPSNVINLGLDLKGGIQLTLEVETEKAVENSVAQTGQAIKLEAEKENLFIYRPQPLPGAKLRVILPKANEEATLGKILAKFDTLHIVSTTKQENQITYNMEMTQAEKVRVADLAVDQALKTIRTRIDEFGVADPEVRKQQGGRIQIQLPGITDPTRAKKIIEQTAHLEFRMVADVSPSSYAPNPDTELLYMNTTRDGKAEKIPFVVYRAPAMTGENIADAGVGHDEFGRSAVDLRLNPAGAAIFENLTAQNKGKLMAIVLDGKIYSAPQINDKISGGRASITGKFSAQEANDLSVVLRSGSLPAPVKILEERTVGPSLGQDSINQGVMASLVGGAVVVLFMIVYYGFSGFIADLALMLNIVLIMAGLACFGATLTLPGIAGIILTIGTAVDANVLINERIREELRHGNTVKASINEGYHRATLTIVDSHVTSIIAALVLYQFGTGPIRGFAVTMTLGMVASLFTAVFVSRVILDAWTYRKQLRTFSV